MGEKQDLRDRLDHAVRRGNDVRVELAKASDEIRRLRSDVATLTDRLEDTHRRLQDQRAFYDAVARLEATVVQLRRVTPPDSPPTGADQQEGTTTT